MNKWLGESIQKLVTIGLPLSLATVAMFTNDRKLRMFMACALILGAALLALRTGWLTTNMLIYENTAAIRWLAFVRSGVQSFVFIGGALLLLMEKQKHLVQSPE